MNDQRIIAGRYRLEGVLGSGGQATVHRALDMETGCLVAVKELNGQLAKDSTVVARVAREQQAMVALAGTNAVQFIDLCTGPEGSLCLVMELLEGRDLESFLSEHERKGQQLPISDIVRIMEPVVDTLDRAHAVGIVHRDLKPGNIFLLSEQLGGGTRLLDFGLANLESSEALTAAGLVMGSPSYIAPESWAGVPGRSGARADIYSLGVILFRMLGGRLPFIGKSLVEKMRNATSADRPSLHELRDELPPQVDIWVERALAVDPNERFATPGACLGELLWALKLAPHPSEQLRPQLPKEQADEVRSWLASDAPPSSLPFLSIEPMPISLEPLASQSQEATRYVSVEPMPCSEPSDAPKRQPAGMLPPIPRPPLLPDGEVSASLSKARIVASVVPSLTPERSGVRANDEWEDATKLYTGLERRAQQRGRV